MRAPSEHPGRRAVMPVVVLVGTLDTKGPEYAFLRDRIRERGCEVVLVDAGVMSDSSPGDVPADEVAAAAGEEGGGPGAGPRPGAGGGARAPPRPAPPARAPLPIGAPKLIVSTMAAGDTRPCVGSSDVAMLHSVVDFAGIDRLSERILTNAAAAIAGMAGAHATFESRIPPRPLIGATMFGITTPCVTVARDWLEARGYEVLVFHATGSGGRAMEALMRSGFITGVLDVTTTELADELIGGVLSAGPERLETAGAAG